MKTSTTIPALTYNELHEYLQTSGSAWPSGVYAALNNHERLSDKPEEVEEIIVRAVDYEHLPTEVIAAIQAVTPSAKPKKAVPTPAQIGEAHRIVQLKKAKAETKEQKTMTMTANETALSRALKIGGLEGYRALQELAKSLGLKANGKKDVLVARIEKALNGEKTVTVNVPKPEAEDAPAASLTKKSKAKKSEPATPKSITVHTVDFNDYRAMQQLCKELGLKANGKKADMVARLKEAGVYNHTPSEAKASKKASKKAERIEALKAEARQIAERLAEITAELEALTAEG